MAADEWLTLDGTPFTHREFSRLWLAATATYGVGDVVTTIAVLQFTARVDEANPLLGTAVDHLGRAGLVGLKLAVFLLCLGVSVDAAHRRDSLLFYFPPVTLSAFGIVLTVHNLRLLAA